MLGEVRKYFKKCSSPNLQLKWTLEGLRTHSYLKASVYQGQKTLTKQNKLLKYYISIAPYTVSES